MRSLCIVSSDVIPYVYAVILRDTSFVDVAVTPLHKISILKYFPLSHRKDTREPQKYAHKNTKLPRNIIPLKITICT